MAKKQEYEVVKGMVLVSGKMYHTGKTVELTDEEAKNLGDSVVSKNAQETVAAHNTGQDDTPYSDMKVDELAKLAEDLNLNVEGTGKDGQVLKADYVKALEQA